MKIICAVFMLLLLSGCAGLNVQWAAAISFNSPATMSSTMTPGVVTKKEVNP